jgi:hypothetical protein
MKKVLFVFVLLLVLLIAGISAAQSTIPVFSPYGNGPLITNNRLPFDRLFRTGANEYLLTVLEENSAGNYPADYNVDMMVSTDGTTWDYGKIIRAIITPSQTGNTFNYHVSIHKDGNTYKAWSSATSDGNVNYNDLYYSYSSTYSNYAGQGLVLARGTDYDSVNIYDPHVVKVGNTYHLYYLADYGLLTSYGFNKNIAHATSPDGINWTKLGVVISAGSQGTMFDSQTAAHPVVVHDGTKFQMFYLAGDTSTYGIGYAESTDGNTWTKIGKIDSLGQSMPVGVTIENGIERLWYTKNVSTGGNHELYLAQAGISPPTENRAPVLDPIGNRNVSEGNLLQFIVTASDPDGDTLTYAASNLPPGASFDSATRIFAWTPGYDQAGVYPNVEFSVVDNGDPPKLDVQLITITVGNTNRPPSFIPIGTQQTVENNPLQFTLSASDPDGQSLTFTAIAIPRGASFNPKTRAFSWIPEYTQAGNYTAVFTVTDNDPEQPLTDTLEVSIAVSEMSTVDQANLIISILDALPGTSPSDYANIKKVPKFIEQNKVTPAINQLDAFIKKMKQDIANGVIGGTVGNNLIGMAQDLINRLQRK